MSLYASRDGALYQSYDTFAGAQGFDETDPSLLFDPYASYLQAPTSQAVLQHELAGPVQVMTQVNNRSSFGPSYFQNDVGGMGSIVVPKQIVESVAIPMSMTVPKPVNQPQYSQAPNQNQRYNPVNFGPNLRGVGIKFAERIDSQSGGMHVYVKHVIPGSPAERGVSIPPGHRISPGDSLLLINGEDVYGLGLDVLRDRIPGPAGSFVVLGFKSLAGDLFEVELQRGEYHSQEQRRQQHPSNQRDDGVIRAPRNRQAQLRNPPGRMYPPGGENGQGPPRFARVQSANGAPPQGGARRPLPPRTMQAPIMGAPGTMSIPIAVDQMQPGPALPQGLFYGGDAQFIAVAPAGGPSGQAVQYQYSMVADYGHQPPSFQPMPAMQPQFPPQYQVVAPLGQGPQFGGQGPQMMPMPMVSMPNPMGQGPPQFGGPAQFGGPPQQFPGPPQFSAEPQFVQMQPHFFQ